MRSSLFLSQASSLQLLYFLKLSNQSNLPLKIGVSSHEKYFSSLGKPCSNQTILPWNDWRCSNRWDHLLRHAEIHPRRLSTHSTGCIRSQFPFHNRHGLPMVHHGVDKSSHANVPGANICMSCHKNVKADSPILEIVRTYTSAKMCKDGRLSEDEDLNQDGILNAGPAIPWERIHKAPDYDFNMPSISTAVSVMSNAMVVLTK